MSDAHKFTWEETYLKRLLEESEQLFGSNDSTSKLLREDLARVEQGHASTLIPQILKRDEDHEFIENMFNGLQCWNVAANPPSSGPPPPRFHNDGDLTIFRAKSSKTDQEKLL